MYGMQKIESGLYEYGAAFVGSATHYIERTARGNQWAVYAFRAGAGRTYRPSDLVCYRPTLRCGMRAAYDHNMGNHVSK